MLWNHRKDTKHLTPSISRSWQYVSNGKEHTTMSFNLFLQFKLDLHLFFCHYEWNTSTSLSIALIKFGILELIDWLLRRFSLWALTILFKASILSGFILSVQNRINAFEGSILTEGIVCLCISLRRRVLNFLTFSLCNTSFFFTLRLLLFFLNVRKFGLELFKL